jgi:hypothetical protein
MNILSNSGKGLLLFLLAVILLASSVFTGWLLSPGETLAAGPANPPPFGAAPAPPTGTGMNIDQALSDEAQRNTISFDGLAFLTGSLGADSFFPPGKVADFWGFQYLRDNDPSKMGHNTDFLTKAANNMLYILTSSQRAELVALAKSQVNSINDYAYKRFVLMKAFRRQLEGDLPVGSSGLDINAVKTYSAQLYTLDGQISYDRAKVMGGILKSLNTTQRAYLDAMVGKGMTSWPSVPDQIDKTTLSHDENVAVMTYAGDLFSWYAGSIEADVYFCPERHGTYFGSFYLKDAPAMGNPNYTIDETITGNMGANFLAALTDSQRALINNLVTTQKPALLQIVDTRRAIATQLRLFISGQTPDQAKVLELAAKYGQLDGEIVYNYASTFAQIGKSLSSDQKTALMAMRTKLLGTLSPTGVFLYSTPIAMPEIPNTDFLFGKTLITFTISVSSGPNGSIKPGTGVVSDGAVPTYTIAANTGYRIADVLVDGRSVGAVSSYTFAPVRASHTISASFTALAPLQPKIKIMSPAGGATWAAGSIQAINWTCEGISDAYVKIELYKGSVLNSTIASSITASSGSFKWSIPQTQAGSKDYYIKVSTTGKQAASAVSPGFSITGTPPPKPR